MEEYVLPNSCRCLKDESCSLVYSPGKLLAFFFVETWPDCKELVVQDGLNTHGVSSTRLFRIQLTFADLDPNQVSPQLVHQLRMICTKLSISSDNDVKDAITVHKLDSTLRELLVILCDRRAIFCFLEICASTVACACSSRPLS